jgi:hypothetical protein
LKSTFQNLPDTNINIVIADNLINHQRFEDFLRDLMIIYACANYDDDLKTNSQQINELEKRIQKVFDKDIKNYLNQNLSNDRMISKNED